MNSDEKLLFKRPYLTRSQQNLIGLGKKKKGTLKLFENYHLDKYDLLQRKEV